MALLAQLRRVDQAAAGNRTRTGDDRHILLAAHLEGHRRGREAGANVDLPQLVERRIVGCPILNGERPLIYL